MCKEMLVNPDNRVADKKRIIYNGGQKGGEAHEFAGPKRQLTTYLICNGCAMAILSTVPLERFSYAG
jgi:hypothetical protein